MQHSTDISGRAAVGLGQVVLDAVSRETYANESKVNEVVKYAFAQVQMHPYGGHSARKTLGQELNYRNLPLAT